MPVQVPAESRGARGSVLPAVARVGQIGLFTYFCKLIEDDDDSAADPPQRCEDDRRNGYERRFRASSWHPRQKSTQ